MSEQLSLTNENTCQPEDLVKGMVKLVSLPHVCIRVNMMVDDPDFSITDIGAVISQDASLTARLLKIANSAFYGFPNKIETVSRAVTVLGTRELRDLIVGVSAVRTFAHIPVDLANMASFWRHSIYCGIVCRLLAARCSILHTERLFIAGLLHDLGQLIVFHKLPDFSRRALRRCELTGQPFYEVEREKLGFDHGDVGAELMKYWQLPQSLQESIKYHHNPNAAEQNPLEAAIVHLADIITHIAELELNREERIQRIDPFAWQITKLSEDVIDQVISESNPLLIDGLAMIMPGEV
jgi:HD-like signal output (HDOD) protein